MSSTMVTERVETSVGASRFSLKEWVFTTDHKRVAVLYMIGAFAAFFVAGIMAMLMRTELASLGPTVTANPNTYNVWLYFHGAAMILGYQIPALTGFFANYYVPLMIGAKDVAFPRVNALSVWLFWMGIVMALLTFVIPDPPDVMWTGYPPYSIITGGNTAFYTFTVLLMGFSSIAGGVNFLTTIIYMRAPGMTWGKLNMFIWCTLAAFIIQLIFVPILGVAVTMLTLDKYVGTHFFDAAAGGSALIYENLFWFYSHPAVYVIFLPAMGIIYEIVATFSRNAIFNYKKMVYYGVMGVVALADLVCVNFPWGGLLRGLLQPETAVLRALASLAKPGGRFQLVLAYDPQRDSGAFTGEPLPVPDETYIDPALVPAYGAAGLAVEERRRLSREEALAIPSTWGRRLLHARPRDVFLLRGSVR